MPWPPRSSALLAEAQKEAFQTTLGFADDARKPRLDEHFEFRFPEDNYPARWRYDGRYTFQKHFFGPPGEFDSDITGEETACAIALDQLPEVKHWVRNLERQESSSFWLPTSTDRFYPDFVAELTDGRILVVEYKGAHLVTGDDAREKQTIGSVWAAASNGRCRFAMINRASRGKRPISSAAAHECNSLIVLKRATRGAGSPCMFRSHVKRCSPNGASRSDTTATAGSSKRTPSDTPPTAPPSCACGRFEAVVPAASASGGNF